MQVTVQLPLHLLKIPMLKPCFALALYLTPQLRQWHHLWDKLFVFFDLTADFHLYCLQNVEGHHYWICSRLFLVLPAKRHSRPGVFHTATLRTLPNSALVVSELLPLSFFAKKKTSELKHCGENVQASSTVVAVALLRKFDLLSSMENCFDLNVSFKAEWALAELPPCFLHIVRLP
jgi:hypothetical protein